MKKLKILVDMDDTIENLLDSWLNFLNKKYNKNIKYDEVLDWDMKLCYPDLTEDQIKEPLYIDSFWETVQPKVDAMYYLEKLIQDGHDVYICTNSNYKTISAKIDHILKKYFPFIDLSQVIVIKDKQLLNADILIDDGIHNLLGGNYMKLLYNAPYNIKYKERDLFNDIIRVYNWKQIYDIISNYDQHITKFNMRLNK